MESPIVSIAFTPDGAFIAGATAGRILIWKVGEHTMPRASWSRLPHPGWLSPKASSEPEEEDEHCLCWDADGQRLAYGANSRVSNPRTCHCGLILTWRSWLSSTSVDEIDRRGYVLFSFARTGDCLSIRRRCSTSEILGPSLGPTSYAAGASYIRHASRTHAAVRVVHSSVQKIYNFRRRGSVVYRGYQTVLTSGKWGSRLPSCIRIPSSSYK